MGEQQRWHLVHEEQEHLVQVSQRALTREVTWTRSGTQLATKKTTDDTIVLAQTGDGGAVRLKFPSMGPARRVTLHGTQTEAHAGLGGTDFEPEAGSKAAQRAEWIGRHPHLHTVRQTAVAAAGVGVPILVVWLLTLVPWPSIPWPDVDLPSIPRPDLPSIPWPDIRLPAIPWPDVDLPDLPPWVDTVRKFAIPILIAFFVARGEVKRRRKADEKQADEKQAEDEAAEGAEVRRGPRR